LHIVSSKLAACTGPTQPPHLVISDQRAQEGRRGDPGAADLPRPRTRGIPGDDAPPPSASLSALQDIILTVGSSLDLPTVLQRVVEVIADATGQTDSYIYLYDEEADDLVLSAATESVAAPYVGRLRMALGEGVTGWVGASRQSHVIERELDSDPRYARHAELGEERYDSMICAPIVSRSERLIGVVSVWAVASGHFTAEHVRLAEWIAVVVAGAIENAQLHASMSRRTRVLERMAELSALTTSGLATVRVLDLVTDFVREVGAADLAVMLVRDPQGTDRLILKSVGAELAHGGERLQAARRELLNIDAEVRRRGMTWHLAAEEVRARLGQWFEATATAPLRIAGEDLGLLCCYRVTDRSFTTEDQALLSTIASQAALTLKNALLAEELVSHNELGHFLRDVVAGHLVGGALRDRAATLGLNGRSYAFVVGSVEFEQRARSEWEGSALVLRQVTHSLGQRITGARCTATANEAIAIVPSAGEGALRKLRTELDALGKPLRQRLGAVVTFGISSPTDSVEDFRTALTEAREALTVGSGMGPAGGVFTLDDVGHYLLLSRAADLPSVRDRYSAAIETVAEYDRVKRASLIETLSVFLDVRSRNQAARALFVHRNTLAQRLERVESLTGLDLSDNAEWFPLQLALKVHDVRNLKTGG
jgi:GAF domain-containing protein